MTSLNENLMAEPETGRVFIALVHYPVYNKRREVIASALTTIDIHDLARLAMTYGAEGFFLVTPLEDQAELARKMLEHWLEGWGSSYNNDRAESMRRVVVAGDLKEVEERILEKTGRRPVVVATAAGDGPGRSSYFDVGPVVRRGEPVLILFGTAWGLTREVLEKSDYILAPVKGPTGYNHLSVRSAAGIVLDRLFGERN